MLARFVRLALVAPVLFVTATTLVAAEPQTLLLLGHKPDGHPAGTHEYLPAQRIVQHLLRDVPGLKTEIVQADDPWSEGPEILERADGVVLFVSQGAKWVQDDPRRYQAFARLAQRQGGFTALHWGTGTKDADDIDGYTRIFGACHGGPDRKYTFFEDVAFEVPDAKHPIVAGIRPFHLREEFYYRLKRADAKAGALHAVVTIPADDGHEMVGWTFDRADGGRSFGYTGLHFHENWRRPEYRRLIAQGVLWTMRIPPPADFSIDVPAELLELEMDK